MKCIRPRFRLICAALCVAFAIAGCATDSTKTPQQTIYQIEGNYRAALKVATVYKSLLSCDQPSAPVLCSKSSVVKQLQDADNVAYTLLQAAERTARTPGAGANADTAILAAQEAIRALLAITMTLGTP